MKVFITRKIPGDSEKKLKDLGFEVSVSEFDRALTSEELIERAKGKDALLSLLTDKIDGEVLDAIGPELKIISNYAVGFDNINVNDATQRGVVVTNSACEEVNEAVAEHTWALILGLTRRIVEADEATRRGAYKGWEPDIFLGSSLLGKTLGIVGLGSIGSMVARRATGYQMKIIYNKRTRDVECEEKLGVTYCTLEELLAQSDIVSLHLPLTEETRHLFNADLFSKMKKGSILINTARGSIVDEHDLVQSLKSGHISGCCLDVFDNEPNIDPELIGMENVILTPHIASATFQAREAMTRISVEAISDFFNNKEPQNIVNKDVWTKRRK